MTSLHAGSGETSPTLKPYTDGPTANLVARLEEIAEQQERRAGRATVMDAFEFSRDAVAIREIARRVLASEAALRAASDREAALREEIETLSTPDVIGFNDVITYEEEAFEGMSDYLNPNDKPRQVWANRSFGSEWYAARVVASWDADGDVVDDEIRLFRTLDEANAALAESEAKRVSALSSDEQTNE